MSNGMKIIGLKRDFSTMTVAVVAFSVCVYLLVLLSLRGLCARV